MKATAIFSPAVALMKSQRYRFKFLIVGIGVTAATLFLLGSLLVSLWTSVELGKREIAGLDVIKPTLRLVQLVQRHRGLSMAVLAGDESLKEKAAAKELEIASAIKTVDAALAAYRNPPAAMEQSWSEVKTKWTNLAGEWSDVVRPVALSMYSELSDELLKFVNATGDSSSLAIDPSLDSYYLVGVSVYAMPDMIELVGRAGDAGADAYARKALTEVQRAEFAERNGVLRRIANDLDSRLNRSANYNDAIKPTLAKFREQFLAGANEVFVVIDGDFVAGRLGNAPSLFASKTANLIDQGYATLFGELLPTAEKLIGERLARIMGQFLVSLAIALALLGICGYLSVGAYLAVIGDLDGLSHGAKQIGDGDLTARVPVTSKDEMAIVARGFNTMADSLDAMIQTIREKTADVQAMLVNIPQGILTVISGNTIHPEYSAYLVKMFETQDIAGKSAMDVVFSNTNIGSDTLSQVEAAMAACIGEDLMNYEFNCHLFIGEFEKTFDNGRVKSLELSWSPICNADDVVEKLMLCVRDVTELKQLAAEAGQQKRELEIIGQILAVNQEKFHEFVDSAGEFIAENERLIRSVSVSGGEGGSVDAEVITQLFRNMHTVKGNARTYGLLYLTNLVHEAEQAYEDMRQGTDTTWDPQRLLGQLHATQSAMAEYVKINEVKLGRKGPGRRGGVDKFLMVQKDQIQQALDTLNQANADDPASMARAIAKVRNSLQLIGSEGVESMLAGVLDSLPSLARELGKEPPQLTVSDHGIAIRNQIADLIRNVFMHLYRNSMDHGIETPDKRLAKGKPAAGHIGLDVSTADGRLVFKLSDDGAGLAVAVIRQKAIDKGLIDAGQQASPEEIAQLVFAPGFSTAAAVTEVSGRGVGMDAVKSFVEREGGSIELVFRSNDTDSDYRAFDTVIGLPDKFAVQAT